MNVICQLLCQKYFFRIDKYFLKKIISNATKLHFTESFE